MPDWFDDLVLDAEDDSRDDDGRQRGLRDVGAVRHQKPERLKAKHPH
jgi:hypothetical protein